MSTLLEQVEVTLQRVIDEGIYNGTEAIRSERDAKYARWLSEADALRGRRNEALRERDAARAELAGVAAQRDAHLSRSVELATELQKAHEDVALESATRRMLFTLSEDEIARLRAIITRDDEVGKENAKLATRCAELEARLAALIDELTPEPELVSVETAEVDGFRVGDLVLAPGSDGRVSRIVGTEKGIKLSTHEWHHNADPSKLTRKPIEVGDTVRHVSSSPARYTVAAFETDGENQFTRTHQGPLIPSKNLVAVAP